MKDLLLSQIKRAKSKEVIDSYHIIENKKNSSKKMNKSQIPKAKDNCNQGSIFDYSFMNDKPTNANQSKEAIQKPKVKTLYHKAISLKILRETKLDEERFKKRIEEVNSMRSPVLNSKSILLASRNKSRNAPLYLRIHQIQVQRENNLARLRETYAQRAQDEHCLVRAKSANCCFNKWLTISQQREQNRKSKLRMIQREVSQKELNDESKSISFKPDLNENSRRIASQREMKNNQSTSSLSRVDQTSERLYQSYYDYEKHKNEMRKGLTPSFKPTIYSMSFKQLKPCVYVLEAQEG